MAGSYQRSTHPALRARILIPGGSCEPRALRRVLISIRTRNHHANGSDFLQITAAQREKRREMVTLLTVERHGGSQ